MAATPRTPLWVRHRFVAASIAVTLTAAATLAMAARIAGSGRPTDLRAGPCMLDAIAWSDPVRVRMPHHLREISGLVLLDSTRLLAHDDERGLISVLDATSGEVTAQFELGPKLPRDDFEGIAMLGRRLYLMTSRGRLYETSVGKDGGKVPFRIIDTGLRKRCEFEGLAADPATRTLLIPCKRPFSRELRGKVTIFAWSVDRGTVEGLRLSVPVKEVRGGRGSFRPSAVEVLPGGDLLVLSGADHSLAEVTPPATVRCFRRLGSGHPQAEGIALLPDGSLAISDEGRPARLTFYRRRSP